MAWLALYFYIAGAMTAFHHINEALDDGLTFTSIFLGVVIWPIFWPVMYAVAFFGTILRRGWK
jgi:hypothetical protein